MKPGDMLSKVRAVLFGTAVGDALGVPVEFKSRRSVRMNPVTEMTGFGTYGQPPGTFSDDSSLSFILAEVLTEGYDLNRLADHFLKWRNENYWTPLGDAFDIGISTSRALSRLAKGEDPRSSGCREEGANGNGSLMRIAPLVFYTCDKPVTERFELAREVSSVTHAHIRSVISCFYYLEFLRQLLEGRDKFEAYNDLKSGVTDFLKSVSIEQDEIDLFGRLLKSDIYKLPEDSISGSGYVIHTLEASVWCVLTTESFRDAVLTAVNLGEDADTTGAVTGAMAGLLYGIDSIPKNWKEQLARHDDIEDLAERMAKKFSNQK